MLRAKGVLVRAEYPGFEKPHSSFLWELPEEMRAFWNVWGRDYGRIIRCEHESSNGIVDTIIDSAAARAR